jgi:hypothetical protein
MRTRKPISRHLGQKNPEAMWKFLAELAAFDGQIYAISDRRSRIRMGMAGLVILLIVILTIFSTFSFFGQVFTGSTLLTIFIASVMGMIVLNLLLLLNLTVSNDISQPKEKRIQLLSTILRIGFVTAIALLVAEPVKLKLYPRETSLLIDSIRIQKYIELTALDSLTLSEKTPEEIHLFQEKVDTLINDNSFIMEQIKHFNKKYPFLVLFNILIALLFVTPLLIRLLDKPIHDYKIKQHEVSKRIIVNEFNVFTHEYLRLFKDKYGLDHAYHTCYEDPPFNTLRKEAPALPEEEDFEEFLNSLYEDAQ